MAADDDYYDCLDDYWWLIESEEDAARINYNCTKEAFGGLWSEDWYTLSKRKCPLCGKEAHISNRFGDDCWLWEHDCMNEILIDSSKIFFKSFDETNKNWEEYCNFVSRYYYRYYRYDEHDDEHGWVCSENELKDLDDRHA